MTLQWACDSGDAGCGVSVPQSSSGTADDVAAVHEGRTLHTVEIAALASEEHKAAASMAAAAQQLVHTTLGTGAGRPSNMQ